MLFFRLKLQIEVHDHNKWLFVLLFYSHNQIAADVVLFNNNLNMGI